MTPEIGAHPTAGGAIRSARLLRATADHADVTVVAVGHDPGKDLREHIAIGDVRVYPTDRHALSKRATALRRRWPLMAARAWSADAARAVAARVEAGDVLVLDQLHMAAYRPAGAPAVLSLQNAESHLLSTLPPPPGAVRRLERRWEVATLARMERHHVGAREVVPVVVSEGDARLLGDGSVVIPNGTDLPASVTPVPSRRSLLFIGSLSYEPNVLGLRWWSEHVWPRLRQAGLPMLDVVGRGAPAPVLPGLVRHGEVPSVRPWLDGATVVVVPLTHGGGTRLKILEAMAHGRPVVSTTKGAEGFPVRHGREILLADTPEAFAAAVQRLWDDADTAARLAEHGREFATAYSWDSIGSSFVRLLGGSG